MSFCSLMKNEEFAPETEGYTPMPVTVQTDHPQDAKDYYLIFATRPAIGNFWN